MSAEHDKNTWIENFLATANEKDKQLLLDILRDNGVYLANDMDDIVAILEQLKNVD